MPGEWIKLYGEFAYSHITKVHCTLRRCKGSGNFLQARMSCINLWSLFMYALTGKFIIMSSIGQKIVMYKIQFLT